MSNQGNKNENEQMKDLLLLWLKHWQYFAISFFVCGLVAVIYLKTATPVMNIVAQVSLRHNESLLGSSISKTSSLMNAFGLSSGSENIEDESLKMSSFGNMRQVVKNLGLNIIYIQKKFLGLNKTELFDRSPIVLSVAPEFGDTIQGAITFNIKVKEDKTKVTVEWEDEEIGKFEVTSFPVTLNTVKGDFTLQKSDFFNPDKLPLSLQIVYLNYDDAAQNYQDDITIDFQKKNSDIINMYMASADPVFAKKVLNEIIAIYNKEWSDDKVLVSERTREFIDNRLILTKELLDGADKNIQVFKDKYNMTEIEADVEYYLTVTGKLQAELLQAQIQSKSIDIIMDFVRDEKNKYSPIPYIFAGEDSKNQIEVVNKYNEALIKRNEFYKTGATGGMAQSLDDQIEMQRKNLLLSLENLKKSAQIAVDKMTNKESELNKKIGNVPTIEKNYVQLRREQELQQTIYIYLLQMREETGVRGIDLLPKLKVIAPPYTVVKPLSPNKIKTAIMTVFVGWLLSLCALYGIPYIGKLRRKEGQ